jgi:uncharacterized protein YidB (DUF937 family)
MLISPDKVVTGALVNAIAVVGRQISKAMAGLRKPDEVLATARWFETFRLSATLPSLPDPSSASTEQLAALLEGAEVQAALQELLAARLTDAPETDASQARHAVRVALSSAGSDAVPFAEALADYYDDQICSLVARLEAEEPPALAQIRGEAFSSRMITSLHAIERNTATLTEKQQVPISGSQGVQIGDNNTQVSYFVGEHASLQEGGVRPTSGSPAGRPLEEVTDPFALEVHRPVQADGLSHGLPALPAYVRREHDQQLAEVVRAAAEEGTSAVAVLVGGSSTGKTRACWEALGQLREGPSGWRLWHPIDPSRPESALRDLPSIGPRTVVWLNEAQFYLDAAGGSGEQVAAGIRELLRDPGRGPVLVLATLWPEFWNILTTRPPAERDDPHAQARELISGRELTVPARFTAAEVQVISGAADPRLAMAATARDGQVVQFLAGAPELLTRYRNAPPATAALINAAIDGRRLGIGVALPLGFLEAAAPAYLTEVQWDRVNEDWLRQALEHAAADCKGARGPLTRIRYRPSADGAPAGTSAYRLADYLDQQGRQSRRSIIPPTQFWAAAIFAAPDDLGALAQAAEDRGLLRDAARLRKHASRHGNTRAAAALITSMHRLRVADTQPARWVTSYATLEDPGGVAWLLWALQEAGATEQIAALLARDPAVHANLNDPYAVAQLLRALRRAGGTEQVGVLADRAAAHANLNNPYAVARLLRALRVAGLAGQVETLTARIAAHANLNDSRAIARLVQEMSDADAAHHIAALFARDPAANATLDDPVGVARLLQALRKVGAVEQAETLGRRAASHAKLSDSHAVARLLREMRAVGAADQTTALIDRDPATYANLNDPGPVAALLRALRRTSTAQAAVLLARDPASHANLDDPRAVAALLRALRRASTAQTTALLARDPAGHATLDDPGAVSRLLEQMRAAGAADQIAVLLARDPAAHVNPDDPAAVAQLLQTLPKVGAADQAEALATRAAAHANLADPRAVAGLLGEMQSAGADTIAVLLARDPAAHVNLDDPGAVAELLRVLQEIGATGQFHALAERLPAEGLFDLFCEATNTRESYIFGREPDGEPACAWHWDDLE